MISELREKIVTLRFTNEFPCLSFRSHLLSIILILLIFPLHNRIENSGLFYSVSLHASSSCITLITTTSTRMKNFVTPLYSNFSPRLIRVVPPTHSCLGLILISVANTQILKWSAYIGTLKSKWNWETRINKTDILHNNVPYKQQQIFK